MGCVSIKKVCNDSYLKRLLFITTVGCLILTIFVGISIYFIYSSDEVSDKIIVKKTGSNPHIYGDRVVWEDHRNQDKDIYLYELDTNCEIPICVTPGDQIQPRIFEKYIVWQDNRHGNWDIFMYDLQKKKEIPICIEKHDQKNPDINNNIITWSDQRYYYEDINNRTTNDFPNIFYFNITSDEFVCINKKAAGQVKSVIQSTRILYLEIGHHMTNNEVSPYRSLMLYDVIRKENQIIYSSQNIMGFDFNQNNVVFQTLEGYNNHIYYLDINTNLIEEVTIDREVSEDYVDNAYPQIDQDLILWRSNHKDLAYINISSEISGILETNISGFSIHNNIVVFEAIDVDNSNETYENSSIYFVEISL